MQRYFVNDNQLNNNHIEIKGSDVHHIKNVMRMQIGDKVICACYQKAYLCEIEDISDIVNCLILEDITKKGNESFVVEGRIKE